ncbi:MAG: MFS transporter [Paramuribaculum sp.]|nr:MFS transporter [Paramuribaculum sp.]
MNKSLLSLSFGTFALGIAEFAMMGILSTMANDFNTTVASTGHLISAYALGVTFGAPALLFLRRMQLRKIMLLLAALIFVGNTFTALAPNFYTMLVARFLSGLPHGAYFGVGAIVAQRLASPGHKAQAVSIMVSGMTVATLIGVPGATFLTEHLSWRITFAIVALAAALTLLSIKINVPDVGKIEDRGFKGQFAFLKNLAPWLIFGGTIFGQTGIYCWYSYVDPLLTNISGFSSDYLPAIMVIAGFGMFAGNLLSGKLADKYAAGIVSGLIATTMIPVMILIYILANYGWAEVGLTFLGTAGLFGIGGPLQFLIVRYSKGGEMLGAAGIQISFNLGNAIAAWIGGTVINFGMGYAAPAIAGVPLLIISATLLFYLYHRYERNNRITD